MSISLQDRHQHLLGETAWQALAGSDGGVLLEAHPLLLRARTGPSTTPVESGYMVGLQSSHIEDIEVIQHL